MKVSDPDGQVWRVSRRWLPWRMRRRDPSPDLDLDLADDLVVGLVLFVIGLVVWPLVGFLFIGVLEALLLAVLVPVLALGRVALGRHWKVQVHRGRAPWAESDGGPWAQSGRRVREIAGAIERGDPPLPMAVRTTSGRRFRLRLRRRERQRDADGVWRAGRAPD